jgi:hypothetical protein
MLKNGFGLLASTFDALFTKSDERKWPWLKYLWLAGLYLLGIFMWGKFFSWGKPSLDFFDWALINVPRLDFIQDALRNGLLPLHMADTASLHDISDRFFTLPDVVTTPQMILLLFLPIEKFVFIDILISYTLGFAGILWFRQKYALSLYTFAILFLLFGFNGYILTHYSVGHFTWAAYFLFPAFFSLLIRFLDGEQSWRWVSSVSFLLFYMVLAGSQHHFVWLLIFMGIFALVMWRRPKWIFVSIISAGLLSAIRLLPPVLQLAEYQKKAIFNAVYGYPSLSHLLYSMCFIQLPTESPLKYFSLNLYSENYWDFNFYLGILGTCFILYFGIFTWLKERPPKFQQFIIPTFAVLALAIDSTYWIIRLTDIPLFASERSTMRIVALPLVWLMLVAAILFQEWWNTQNMGTSQKIVALIVLGFVFIDLWSNLKIWRPSEVKSYFAPVVMNIAGNSVANHADPLYFTVLWIGLGITLVTAAFLLLMSWRERKKQIKFLGNYA